MFDLIYSSKTFEIIAEVWDCESDEFGLLREVAGLDKARDFRFSDLRGLDFRGVDLRGFDLTGANLEGTNFKLAVVDETTLLDNWEPMALSEIATLLTHLELIDVYAEFEDIRMIQKSTTKMLALIEEEFGGDESDIPQEWLDVKKSIVALDIWS